MSENFLYLCVNVSLGAFEWNMLVRTSVCFEIFIEINKNGNPTKIYVLDLFPHPAVEMERFAAVVFSFQFGSCL